MSAKAPRLGVPRDARYLVRIYAPTNQGGHLLIETWHRTEASKEIEIAAALARARRGEVGYIHSVDLERPFDGVSTHG